MTDNNGDTVASEQDGKQTEKRAIRSVEDIEKITDIAAPADETEGEDENENENEDEDD